MSNTVTKAMAIQSFWESASGITCYEENTVPDTPTYPYISYQLNTGGFGDSVPMVASLYYKETGWNNANAKAEAISDYVGSGGKKVPFTDGVVWITRASNFAQHFSESQNKNTRRIILTINAEFQK